MKKILLTLFTVVFALNVAAKVYEGENGSWRWRYDTHEQILKISGSGSIDDYTESNAPWFSYYLNDDNEEVSFYRRINEVIIAEGITRIGNNCFGGLNIKKVSLPSTLQSIGSKAFYNCTSLTTINVPESVTDFGTQVFSGCTNLTNSEHIIIKVDPETVGERYDIPANVKYIEENAFNGCTDLRYLVYKEKTNVGGYIANTSIMNQITTTIVPSDLYNSFSDFHGLRRNETKVYVKSDYYVSYAFLHDVTIPANVTAYTATTDGSVVTLVPITAGTILAGDGVFLKATTTKDYTFTNGKDAQKAPNNQLVGVTEPTTLNANDNAYVMQTKNKVQKFYKVGDGHKLARFKAYLKFDGGEGAKMFSIFDEYTTDIEETEEEVENPANSRTQVYNMAGQKLSAPQKGLNIINGKIVVK